MNISGSIKDTRNQVKEWKSQGLSVALVPTMGYLHDGHKSLMERARKENDKVVVSIFVNPMQFGPQEDYDSYPRDLERDGAICQEAGVDWIFHPEVEEMYGPHFCGYVDMHTLPEKLCGASRPVHFRGVQTVVSKLFHIIPAQRAYFGQKDAQQLAIIRRMVMDLDFDIEIIGCPIVREADGLAKSSRNTYLSREERAQAVILNQSLEEAMRLVEAGEKEAEKVKEAIIKKLSGCPLARIDYVEIVSFDNIQPIQRLEGPVLIAIAVYIGTTRLIDNRIIM
ncbi:MAG: pantoate--beta-alanine ligase [Lachnospiraceae bacterium]|nr:pantoate--beta-alanine ligase [Lachnospiraceae bacterium]MCI9149035.1 pantoate--beta-alanine ligase [Lachnospiraceae bacterium]